VRKVWWFAIAVCAFASPAFAGVPAAGGPAPKFSAPLAGGGNFSLASLHGKPVYLNFFASWCAPCNEEAPGINALQKKYAARGLHVIGIDEQENAGKAMEFVKKYALGYPAVVDANGSVMQPYGAIGLPLHVFIDRKGKIKVMRDGEMTQSEIDAAIKSIL